MNFSTFFIFSVLGPIIKAPEDFRKKNNSTIGNAEVPCAHICHLEAAEGEGLCNICGPS